MNCTFPCVIINDKFVHMSGTDVIWDLTKTSDTAFPQNFASKSI